MRELLRPDDPLRLLPSPQGTHHPDRQVLQLGMRRQLDEGRSSSGVVVMATVEPSDRKGVWRARAYLGRDPAGRQLRPRTTITAPTRSRAQRLADAWEDKLRAEGRTDYRPRTVADAVEAWLQACELKGNEPRTMHSYRRLGDDIVDQLGARRVEQLTVADVEAFYRKLLARGTRVSHHHAALRGALNKAMQHGWVNRNVARLASRPTERTGKGAPPTVNEIEVLLKVARERSAMAERLIVVAIQTGMRRGELAAMRRSRFDVDRWTYTVDTAVWAVKASEGVHLKAPKTHTKRVIPLSDQTVAAILAQAAWLEDRARVVRAELAPDPFLWSPAPDCSVPPHPDWLTREFAAVRRAAGVSARFHDLRHAMATLMLDLGVPLPTVSERLGHANTHTTASIYAHGVSVRGREAAELLGRAFQPAGELEA